MNGDLKTAFTQKVVGDYMKDVIETMQVIAKRAKIHVTGEAIKSLAYEVTKEGGGVAGKLSFKEYLRMVDMGVGRAHPLGGLTSMREELQSRNFIGRKQVKDMTRKPKKIYSKTVYGKLTHMQNQLLHGYGDEAIAAIKKEMESSTNQN
jgi:uncharacterized protein with HEPN domain